MPQARSSYVRLIYQGKNITQDIAPFLTQFTFTDNSGGKADDISITLEDREALWIDDWYPEKGDKIQASIIHVESNSARALPCGSYEVDQIDYSAPPRIMQIKAVSTAISKNMRHAKHDKSWENINLKSIASELASANNLKLYYDAEDFTFERKVQSGISDLEFLKSLCEDSGLNLKVSNEKLIIYDIEKNDLRDSVNTIKSDDKKLINWKFSIKSLKVYKSAQVKYHDSLKNKTYEAKVDDDTNEGSEEVLVINERVESQAAAQKLATKRLRSANSREIEANLQIMGCIDYLAGNNITVEGFGKFDGKYRIAKVTHKVDSSGYTSNLDIQMGNPSKAKRKSKTSKRQRKGKQSKNKALPELYYEGTRYAGSEL